MTRQTALKACIAVLIGAAALGTMGCRRGAGIVTDRQMARYEEQLVRVAARDTGCHHSQLSPSRLAGDPAVYTVTGCAQPVEYWLQCSRRRCTWRNLPTLNESAAAQLQCAPASIQQQPSQAPNVRFANGCGRMQPYTIACNGQACGWAPSGPAQGGPAPQVAQPQVAAVAPPAPPPQPPSAVLQTQVQQQREAILSCVDSPSLTLRLRWTADGQVILQMPQELLGTAAEGCLQALLGGMRVVAQADGEVVVPLR
jgi:hypothetical protein